MIRHMSPQILSKNLISEYRSKHMSISHCLTIAILFAQYYCFFTHNNENKLPSGSETVIFIPIGTGQTNPAPLPQTGAGGRTVFLSLKSEICFKAPNG